MADYRQIVETFQRAMFVEHDAARAVEVYAADATLWEPALPDSLRGHGAIEEYYASFLRAMPDLHRENTNHFGSDDRFCVELTVRGTNTGPLELDPETTLPPTGRSIEIELCWVGRLDADGLLVEDRTYYDVAGLMSQLGLDGSVARVPATGREAR